MITQTSLIHPVMLAKLRKAMRHAYYGQGELAGGHGHRTYVANRKGHNVMRINWLPKERQFIVYGEESRDITDQVRKAFTLANTDER